MNLVVLVGESVLWMRWGRLRGVDVLEIRKLDFSLVVYVGLYSGRNDVIL